MRHLTPLSAALLSLGLVGCDSSTAADTLPPVAAPAAAAMPVAPVPAPAPAPAPALVSRDASETPVAPTSRNAGRLPRGPRQGPEQPRTLAEIQIRNARIFARLDANADGAVTDEELATLSSGPMGNRGGGRLREMLSRADTDRNSRITLEELRTGAAARFARMDADGDGVLSDAERPERP